MLPGWWKSHDGFRVCEGLPVEIYSKALLVLTSFSPLSSQGPLDPKDYWGVRHDYLSSGELRFHNPKDPEHELFASQIYLKINQRH